MTVDEIMAYAFDGSREWRSSEYKNGVKSVLLFAFERTPPYLRDTIGSAEADAFLSGMEEGWALLEHFGIRTESPVTPRERHQWVEEQRAKVVSNLRTTRDPLKLDSLARSLTVIQFIDAPLTDRPARYPWEVPSANADMADK